MIMVSRANAQEKKLAIKSVGNFLFCEEEAAQSLTRPHRRQRRCVTVCSVVNASEFVSQN